MSSSSSSSSSEDEGGGPHSEDEDVIEAPWLVDGGHGASLRHHKQTEGRSASSDEPASAPQVRWIDS
jgi:hypothetical protein